MTETSECRFERTLADYFRQRLAELTEQFEPPPHQDTIWYTGNLLARFGDTNQLFSYDRGRMDIRPLALLYKDAHETRDPRARCQIMRQLGDLALFMGALFPERFARRGILKDYFIGMGGGAYDFLSEHAPQNRHIFSELSSRFTRMLDLVAKACSKQDLFDASDILDLYQRWRQNQSPRLAQQLRDLGVNLTGAHALH